MPMSSQKQVQDKIILIEIKVVSLNFVTVFRCKRSFKEKNQTMPSSDFAKPIICIFYLPCLQDNHDQQQTYMIMFKLVIAVLRSSQNTMQALPKKTNGKLSDYSTSEDGHLISCISLLDSFDLRLKILHC